jgi:hypothetical protein
MKKTIRLTEAGLSKLIRRVIKEIDGDIAQEISACAMEVLTIQDANTIPTCLELASKVMIDNKIPTDMQSVVKLMSCGSELVKLQKTPADGIKFLNCVLEKIGNVTPVMNTMESRKRRINVK